MSDKIQFSDFPLSYRLSQGSIFLALFSTYASLKIFTANLPPPARTIVVSLVGMTILFGLIVSSYTIIRYPYLSLVSTDDYYLKVFPSSRSCLYTTLKITAILTVAVLAFSFCVDGLTVQELPWLFYMLLLLGFLIYLTFQYDPIEHPTVSTFIRTTLGIGIIVFPIFLPVLIIASWRCRTMLNHAELDLD